MGTCEVGVRGREGVVVCGCCSCCGGCHRTRDGWWSRRVHAEGLGHHGRVVHIFVVGDIAGERDGVIAARVAALVAAFGLAGGLWFGIGRRADVRIFFVGGVDEPVV